MTATCVRVPVPLIPLIDFLHERFYVAYSEGLIDDSLTQDDLTNRLGLVIVDKSEILALSEKLISQKKSAKVTVNKLLQVLMKDSSLGI
jgi:hypothetical protein